MHAHPGFEQRWGRGFNVQELANALRALDTRPSSGPASDEEAARDPSWHHYYSEAVIARERPGPPEAGGAFEQAKRRVANYEFSDPQVVQAYFDPERALRGRPMLLELKVLGVHVLCGVVVRAVRDETFAHRTTYGYRYDTLEGHPEAGAEWFLLSKQHDTGEVLFRIQAAWRVGQLPNWWTRLGFHVLARPYQRTWHRSAYLRLRTLLGAEHLPALPSSRAIVRPWRPSFGAQERATEEGPPSILEHET